MGTEALTPKASWALGVLAILAMVCPLGAGEGEATQQALPNIVLILVDDMGYSDLGCYGGEIQTPNIDRLASQGLRFTQAYNTSKCFPSRAALLTGLYAQECGYGKTYTNPIRNAMTLGEVLRESGYRTLWSGKHHGVDNPMDRGFDAYYGLRDGASNHFNPGNRRPGEPEPAKKPKRPPRVWRMDGKTYEPYTPEDPNFYTTDAFTDKGLEWLEAPEKETEPFFLYLAYTAPHDPLMAWPEDIARYEGRYNGGYQEVRNKRIERQLGLGLFDAETPLPEPTFPDWEALSPEERADEVRRMEVYAAMVDRIDQNVGRLLAQLESMQVLDNTIILIASDNGASAEVTSVNPEGTIGTIDRWESLGEDWANVSNTPLRFFKNYSYEGGIRTPLIAFWPNGIRGNGWVREPVHFIDIMATFVDLTHYDYPTEWKGEELTRLSGQSLLPFFKDPAFKRSRLLFWEWGGGRAVRFGDLKWVEQHKSKTLYDLNADPFETRDLSSASPALGAELERVFRNWKSAVGHRE